MRRPGLPVALGVRRCDSGTARAAAGSARAAGALVSGSSSLLHRFTSTRMASSARPLGTMHVPQSPDTTRSAVLVGLGNSVCLRVARPPCGAHTSHIRLVIGQVYNIRRNKHYTHFANIRVYIFFDHGGMLHAHVHVHVHVHAHTLYGSQCTPHESAYDAASCQRAAPLRLPPRTNMHMHIYTTRSQRARHTSHTRRS